MRKSLFHILLDKACRDNFSGIFHNSDFFFFPFFLNVMKLFNITFEIDTPELTLNFFMVLSEPYGRVMLLSYFSTLNSLHILYSLIAA